ncbi:hypothetical protein [Siminovitchia fordii]|uniref:hypothetical protein n=1 Tax=Siminovitchia fordii TaxID=254759 RepID=UPI000381D13E|nr:hypothetical protein [Siminovitchia fordii]
MDDTDDIVKQTNPLALYAVLETLFWRMNHLRHTAPRVCESSPHYLIDRSPRMDMEGF